jgi:hypothetical protein
MPRRPETLQLSPTSQAVTTQRLRSSLPQMIENQNSREQGARFQAWQRINASSARFSRSRAVKRHCIARVEPQNTFPFRRAARRLAFYARR